MNATYARLISTARRLVTQYGHSVTWKSVTEGTLPDAAKPWAMGAATVTNYTVRIAFFPDDRLFKETQHLVKMSNRSDEFTEESVGSVVGYMAATTFTPKIKDVVTRGSKEYRVSNLKEINVDGTSILWVVQFLL